MRQEGKNLCTFNDPMSSPNKMMYPVLNPLLLGFTAKLIANGALLQNVILILRADFIGGTDWLFKYAPLLILIRKASLCTVVLSVSKHELFIPQSSAEDRVEIWIRNGNSLGQKVRPEY